MSGDAVDFGYLETYAAGDLQVVTEVLTLFRGQAELWQDQLADPGDGWRDLAHMIKGAARGVGANALGDVADRAERGDVRLAPQLQAALADAVAAINGYLGASGPAGYRSRPPG